MRVQRSPGKTHRSDIAGDDGDDLDEQQDAVPSVSSCRFSRRVIFKRIHEVGRSVPKKQRRKRGVHAELGRVLTDAECLDPGKADQDSI